MNKLKYLQNYWKSNQYEIIEDYEKLIFNNHIIYHNSLQDIVDKSSLTCKHMIMYVLRKIFIVLFAIKNILLLFKNDKNYYKLNGDTFHLIFSNVPLIYAMLSNAALMSLIFDFGIFKIEYQGELSDLVHHFLKFQKGDHFFLLNKINQDKLLLLFNVVNIIAKLVNNVIIGFLSTTYITMSIAAYYYNYFDDYNKSLLLINMKKNNEY